MVRRRAAGAGIETAIDRHSFRATGITGHLTNGGRIEVAQRMACHSNAKATGLYDRRADDIGAREVEKGGIGGSRGRAYCPLQLKPRPACPCQPSAKRTFQPRLLLNSVMEQKSASGCISCIILSTFS